MRGDDHAVRKGDGEGNGTHLGRRVLGAVEGHGGGGAQRLERPRSGNPNWAGMTSHSSTCDSVCSAKPFKLQIHMDTGCGGCL